MGASLLTHLLAPCSLLPSPVLPFAARDPCLRHERSCRLAFVRRGTRLRIGPLRGHLTRRARLGILRAGGGRVGRVARRAVVAAGVPGRCELAPRCLASLPHCLVTPVPHLPRLFLGHREVGAREVRQVGNHRPIAMARVHPATR
jgi:hypothetical protein